MAGQHTPDSPKHPEIIEMDDTERFDRWRQGCAHALARALVEGQFDYGDLRTRDKALHELETSHSDTVTLGKAGMIPFLCNLMRGSIAGVVIETPQSAQFGVHWFVPERSAEVHPLVVASWADEETGDYTEWRQPITGDIPGFTEPQLDVIASLADSKVYQVA